MQKKSIIALLVCLAVFVCCGCESEMHTEKDTVNVVCTTFAAYDWTKNLTAGLPEFEVSLVAVGATDLHSYQPTAGDVAEISTASLVFCTGGVSDHWAYLAAVQSPYQPQTLCMLDGVDVQTNDMHDHTHDGETHSPDEHVWLSLGEAKRLCEELSQKLIALSPEDSHTITENCRVYIQQLSELDEAYRETVRNARTNTIVFADRYPFFYLADRYELSCYAAFPGCSAETEAGFETVVFLAERACEQHLTAIAVTEKGNGALSQAVKKSMNAIMSDHSYADNVKTIVLNAMQSVTEQDIADGMTYLAVMKENLESLDELIG